MKSLADLLESTVATAAAHVHAQSDSEDFRRGFEQYLSTLQPVIQRYEHHLGYSVEAADLQSRYKHEVALLHILTGVFSHNVQSVCESRVSLWPVYEQGSPYSWYRLPQGFSEAIEQLSSEFLEIESVEAIIAEVSQLVLDKSNRRSSGEYYTPLPIAEHLIELSGLQATELIDGKCVVDPACGSGSFLASIAKKVVTDALEDKIFPLEALNSLSRGLFGFDIQPFAVLITRSLLIYTCLPILSKCYSLVADSLFPNVRLADALLNQQYWLENGTFHYIIGNPPFFPAKRDRLDYLEEYKEVLYGHPNLYQLFLWWAVRAAKPQGVVSFLLPQSMLSGFYFGRLRQKLNDCTNVLGITRMIDRKGVVGNADQQMMAVCLQVSKDKSQQDSGVNVRVTRSGTDISGSKPYRARYSRVVQRVGEPESIIWVVSNDVLDYEICERLEAKCVTLAELDQTFELGNGGYVWNQHKDLIQEEHRDGSLPLVSAACIRPYELVFPYTGPHASHKRPFSLVNDEIEKLVHSEQAILIQRTTPRKVGRRLVAGIPSNEFHAQYPNYFLENHVNYVKAMVEDKLDLLYGLMGWLNCDLLNFAFQLRNGTAQVSLFDLGLLPVNMEMIIWLTDRTLAIISSVSEERGTHIQAVNSAIFDWVGLGPRHQARIAEVLSRKERADSYGDE